MQPINKGRRMAPGAGGWPAYHFTDEEHYDIHWRVARLGETLRSVAESYDVSPGVIARVLDQKLPG